MIISRVEKESEHEGTQVLIMRGSSIELSTEIKNIMKELLKRNFPQELLIDAVMDAFEDHLDK